MKKKIFTIVLAGKESGQTESLHYAADSYRDLLVAVPVDREVVAVTFGPEIEII